ncbi:MAG TPA: hypothetical protein VL242_45060 [Sorangium sp.]|nr:hypothetical protein [Sorangium sp.]
MPELEDIPEALRLNYYVGDIVIGDSFTEHEGRVLWNALRSVGLVEGDYEQMFGRLLPKLENAFRRPEVPAELSSIALDLLATTRKWHGYRSALVHDLLTIGWGRDDDVLSALGKHPPRKMREMAECAAALRTCGYRLRGLWIIAPHWLGGAGDEWETAEGLRSWTRVAMGEIADAPHTILGTEGPAPEPPGGWDAIVAANVAERERQEAQCRSHVFDVEPD